MKPIVSYYLCVIILCPVSLKSQDTVQVPPGTGTITAAIAADTAGGASHFPPNRVYKLQRGGTYILNGAITTNGFPLRIVGEPPPALSANDPGPAFIQAQNLGAGPDNLINAYGDLTLKNLWITSLAQGNANQWQNVSENSPNTSIIIDGCIFDYSPGVTLIIQPRHITKYVSTNTIYRNQVNPSQWWCGRPNYFNSCSFDTAWIENNTFINEGFSFQEWDYGSGFFWWNHNTLVNTAKFALLNEQWHTTYVANSVFYNSHFTGERLKQDAPGNEPGYIRYYGAVMRVDSLVFKKGADTAITDPQQRAVAEAARWIKLAYTGNYREPWLQAFYDQYNKDKHAVAGSDTFLTAEPMVNSYTVSLFASHPHMSFSHNYDSTDPGFAQAPNNKDSILAFLHAQFYATGIAVDWSWDGGGTGTGMPYRQYTFPWDSAKAGYFYRTPEDLSYTNVALNSAAVGGFPLGDLNWYPARKAVWLSANGSAADKAALDALPAGYTWPTVTSIGNGSNLTPPNYRLEQNYPNPFNPSTTIWYALPQRSHVTLSVFNNLGQLVSTLVNGEEQAGYHEVKFYGSDLSSGVYFYRLQAGSFVQTRKLLIVK